MANEKARLYAADILARRRERADAAARREKQRLYDACPQLVELDRQMAAAGVAAARAALAGEGDAAQPAVAAVEKKRRELLAAHGLQPRGSFHFCERCGDTGYIGNEMCACMKKLISEYAAQRINRESPLELCSFDKFSLDYYSKITADGVSAYKVAQKNLEICREYAGTAPYCYGNLLLMGDAGLGKTHLALSIASEIIDGGFNVVYCSAANIFRQIEEEYRADSRRSALLDEMKSCDLLVLDDLGAEYINAFVSSTIYDLVNTRVNERRCSIYTTNLTSPTKFEMRYGESVASRLFGCCRVLQFIGKDIRRQKAAQERERK